MQLGKPLLADESVAAGDELWIEIDLLGLPPLRTRRLRRDGTLLDFKYSHREPATPGSACLVALAAALSSGPEEDLDVYFVLKAVQLAGGEVELGQGYVSLAALHAADADVLEKSIEMSAPVAGAPPTGHLVVSLRALDALKRATVLAAPSVAQPLPLLPTAGVGLVGTVLAPPIAGAGTGESN